MKGKKRKKYARGTKVTNYVENPQTELMQNDINISKARHESQTDPLLMGLDLLGQLGMQYSSEIGGAIGSMAFGGTTSMVPVNVEGQEVAETPQGELLKFKGPSHEKGGIDVDLPDATEVYSKRISLDGKTMAKRKLEREKRLDKLKMLLEKNPSDQILKNSMERLKTTSASEEEQDTALQNIVSARHEASKKQFAFGGNIDFDEVTGQSKSGFPSTGGNEDILQKLLQTLSGVSQNLDGSGLPSASEGLGLAGTIYSGVSPYLNTLKNRASDTPNESFFKGFGLDALDSIDQQKSFVKEQEDRKLQDLELSRNSALKRNRQVRSINTANALNLATDQGINQAKDQVFNSSAQQMMNILAQQAQVQNQRDLRVMSGEAGRDLADRQDKDNFFTQLSQNQVDLGRSVQEASKNLGQIEANSEIRNTINAYSNYFNIDENGNITDKSGNPLNAGEQAILQNKAEAEGLTIEQLLEKYPDLKLD